MTVYENIQRKQSAFWDRVDRRGDDECWPWKGNRRTTGYGVLSLGKTSVVTAHRASWVFAHDQMVPDGMLVCHSCDHPWCVNPAHLWIGTDADNNRDRASKGRTVRPRRDEAMVNHRRGSNHPASKLSNEQVLAIYQDNRVNSAIAKDYGVHQRTISKIRDGSTYPMVTAHLRAKSQVQS